MATIQVSWETKVTENYTISVDEEDVTPELWEALNSDNPMLAIELDTDLYDEVYSGLFPENEDTTNAVVNELDRELTGVSHDPS